MISRNLRHTLGAACGLLAAVLAVSGEAHAAKFANQFTEFELPPQWQCNLEGAEWVCQSTNDSKKRDAIIVLAAKIANDQDKLESYLAYLKAAKTYTSLQGKPVKSEPKYAKEVNLSGQPWVDALHLESEIPGFYTRYLATVKQDIGVLVTMSVSKTKYQGYLDDFDTMVKSLKVFRKNTPSAVSYPSTPSFANNAPPAEVNTSTVFGGPQVNGGASDNNRKPAKQDLPLPLIAGAGALIAFFVWKKKQAGG